MFLSFGFFLKFTSFIIVFFLPWSKMHVFLLFGVAFLHSWLFYIISRIHFYMRTHLVCICFEFIFIWSCGGDVLFVNFYSDFLQRHIFFMFLLKNHFSFVMFLVTLFDTWPTLSPSLRAVSMTTHLQLDCHTILQKSSWVSLENGPVNR